MSDFATAITGAAIGASAALLGGHLTAVRQARLETERWRRGRQDRMVGEVAAAVGQLTTVLAALAHSMMWATFKALLASDVTAEVVADYERELHQGIAEGVGAQMRIATLDPALYEHITPHMSRAIDLGGETYKALANARDDFDSHARLLREKNRESLDFIKTVQRNIADVVRAVHEPRTQS